MGSVTAPPCDNNHGGDWPQRRCRGRVFNSMAHLPPLRFEPIFKDYLWGGRRLESLLGKRLGPGDHFAEGWEVVDHGMDQSVVADGPLAGATLHELVTNHGEA